MFRSKFFSGFFLVLVFCNTVSAQEVSYIYLRAIEAVGGKKEIQKIRSLDVLADCYGPKGSYSTKISSFRNGKTRFRQSFSYKTDITDIFINNGIGWQNGENTLVSANQILVVHLHEYQKMAFDFQKMFHDFEFGGNEIFGKNPSIKIRAKNELNEPIFLFFDLKTNLLSGFILPIPNSSDSVKVFFNEWTHIGNLKLPSKITAVDNSGEWVLNFKEITFNKSDSGQFDIPPRISDLFELNKLHEQQKTAHLTNNAELFLEMFAENLTQIQRGNVTNRTKAENLARFKNYFNTLKFIEWENLKPPIFRISKDGTLATIIVQKRVRGTYKNEQGSDILDQTDFAWIEVWEKNEGKWKIVTVASTEKVVENKK